MKTFDEIFELLPANGWLTKPEAELLWDAAKECSGPILEVGCYYGRSTVLLASLGRIVYSVDPFSGFDSGDPSGKEVYRAFVKNLIERNIPSFRAVGNERGLLEVMWDKPISVLIFKTRIEDWIVQHVGFAYLDGDHTYQGTLNQIDVAVKAGARVIAIHDIADSGDGEQVKKAALLRLGLWDENVERLAVWRGFNDRRGR